MHDTKTPTPSLSVDQRLSSDKTRRLLDALLRNRSASKHSQPRIPRLPRSKGVNLFPASFAQGRLWFFNQLEPTSPFYNQSLGIMARGRLNKTILNRSLNLIVSRHETLRTTFEVEDRQLVQVISPDCSAHLNVIDLSELPADAREAARQKVVAAETGQPFDLMRGPVLRTVIVQLAEDENFLLFSAHHIVTDYWGLSVFMSELAEVYAALSRTGSVEDSAPIIQYADFATWQREWMRGGVYEKQLDYWKKQLDGVETLRLPTDYARPPLQTFNGAIFRWPLGAEITRAARAFSESNGATLFMTLLAAFKLLLQRYSGQQEVTVGTPIANRNLLELEKLIGFFSNTLVLRTDLGEDPDFRQALRKVKEVCLAAYAHEELPFEKLVAQLRPERDLSQNALFQVMFRMQNRLQVSVELEGLSWSQVWDDQIEPGARFDLELAVRDDEQDLIATLEYNTDLFTPATIEKISKHWQRLLVAVLSNPDTPISRLPLLSEDEREQQLNEWNRTQAVFDQQSLIHELFEQRAELHPQALALIYEQEEMRYGKLNARANQLAHYLRERGVDRESLVAVFLERSMQMVVALLGVLKAGAAYVPVDVSYPAERIAYVLEDANAEVVLTQSHLRDGLPQDRVNVIDLDSEWEEVGSHSSSNLNIKLDAENLAYVIYTSGSTGKPKGAMNTHGAIRNRLLWMQQEYQIDSTDRVLQKTPFSFDVSVWEFFWPLMTGASLLIALPDGHRDSQYLAGLIADRHITTVHFVPSMLEVFLQEPEASDCKSLRRVICSGEALSPELSARCLSRLPTDLHNLYGPTEAAVDVTYWRCKPTDRRPTVPIGKPIANTQIYIVDQNFNLLPVGASGELCIGGVGVARGYLGRPDLTAEKFVPDPFSQSEGARMYRTGDLVHWTTDGYLEFLGRIDRQIKVRGFRIELGEIEAALRQHPAVENVAVVARPDERGGSKLLAYVVADEAGLSRARELQGEQLDQWQTVWNETYEQGGDAADPTFNISGWKSSYSRQLMSDEEMQEWVDHTVDRILALRPERVYEIGCGTGLLLFRVGQHCLEYWASDFSQEVINYLRRHTESLGERLAVTKLLCREACVFEGLEADRFDTIVLNSVVQYFPDIEYLTKVLEGAVHVCAPGGAIFLGDVRSLPLLEAMHASVLLEQADDALDAGRVAQLWRGAIRQEEELVIDPEYFADLKRRLHKISHVEIKPKRGWHPNEMNRFRYDVVIRLGPKPYYFSPSRLIEWGRTVISLSGIEQILREEQPDCLAITGVPNARLASDIEAARLLGRAGGLKTVGQLREAIRKNNDEGIHPEELWSLGEQLPYEVELDWQAGRSDGSFDAVFLRRQPDSGSNGNPVAVKLPSCNSGISSAVRLANNPLRQKSMRRLEPELQWFVERKLPDYMVPSSFTLLDALPLSPNGKLDRKALIAADTKTESQTKYIAPQNLTEEMLCMIWEQVLRLDRVGVEENFFDLGGHSLLATQVVSRVRSILKIKIPLHAIFENPTVRRLAAKVEEVKRRDKGLSEPPLVKVEHREDIPLSFAQERLWFMDQLEPGSIYNMAGGVRLTGSLDIAALHRSITRIVTRHEVLRTCLPQRDGQPFQKINPARPAPLPVIDLSALGGNLAQTVAEQITDREAQQGFDLSRGPLIRVRLLRLSLSEHVLVVVMHHVVSDGWSLGVLIREFKQMYDSYSRGEEPEMEELKLQYADFAVWQREYMRGEVYAEQMSYWKEQLKGMEALELPTDRARPAIASHTGGRVVFRWGEELTSGLKAIGRQEGVTLFMVMVAGFEVMLSRYSGQQDVAIGTDVANRNRRETEGLIGFFVNQVVVRNKVERGESFRELVGRVREVTMGAYEHQDVPFERVVEEMGVERDLSRGPLFQVKCTLQNMRQESLELDRLLVEEFPIQFDTVKVDLHLMMQETDGELEGALYYASDLFDRATAERMLKHLEALMRSITATPEGLISELDMLSQEEREQVLYEWNQTRQDFEPHACVHDIFERQVERKPQAVALVYGDQQISYAGLNAKANQLAHYLRNRGVGPETLVGVYVERSIEMVAALLAVLKAGGAYVPMDASYPAERIAYMLEDANAEVVLTQSHLRDGLPQGSAEVICIDTEWGKIAAEQRDDTGVEPDASNLAYVLYTSGSTGVPKGVAIAHQNAVAMIGWACELFTPEQLAGVLASTSICFDLSVFELFVPLCVGGKVIIIENALELPSVSAASNVTLINTVPSAISELLNLDCLPESAHTINLAGEPLTRTLTQALYQRASVKQVYNLYGPTEDTTYSTFSFVDKEASGGPTIGRPIANSQAYVLSDSGGPVPVGVVGELYLAGQGVSRGYLNKPDLTSERFVPDPFSAEPGARMYRTGDLVRYLANGELDYIGRADYQVKVRGHRIELGEIEEVLGTCDGVEHCAVAVRGQSDSDRRLVGYVVAKEGRPLPSVRHIQEHLLSRLPKYMVPSMFVELGGLPLTPNGKLDRKALPAPDQALDASGSYRGPRTPIEEILCGIWQRVIKINRVGIDDNFFELGGHSLLATRLISSVRGVFQVELPVRVVFESPTVASLARVIESAKGQATQAPLPIKRASRNDSLPLSFAQQRLWFMSWLEPDAPYNLPGGVRLKGNLDLAALRYGVNEIVSRHEVLRTCFIQQDGQPIQHILDPQPLPLPIIEISHLDDATREAEANRLAQEEAQRPFDLGTGPLIRVILIRMTEDEHILMVTMHHIASDGWSISVFVRELSALYKAFQFSEPYPLTDLPIQYADFAVWQAEDLRTDTLDSHLSFWKQHLSDIPAMLGLPTDRPRPVVQSFKGARHSFALSQDLTTKLKLFNLSEGATLHMTLLAAFNVLLYRYSGQKDILVGTPVANRNRVEVEALIGFFVNMLVIRTNLSDDISFRQLLNQVREVALAAYAHQDVPFEKLVEEINPERGPTPAPIFQVAFDLHNHPSADLELPGLTWELTGPPAIATEYDIVLNIVEEDREIVGEVHYNTDLFDDTTIARMFKHYCAIVESVVAEPAQRVSTIPFLTDAEIRQLLTEFNGTKSESPQEKCLHQLFEDQVKQTPYNIAIEFEGHQLTYDELNRKSNQLAHYLRGLTAGPEVIVGICMERGLEMLVALLGIMKSGGAYLAIDPSYPFERISFILDDSLMPVLLTQENLLGALPDSRRRTICIDTEWESIAQESEENLNTIVTLDNLAYVIYTSGSTGTPKGTLVCHRGLSNLSEGQVQVFKERSDGHVLQFASLSFDASVFEIAMALRVGATLHVPNKDSLLPTEGFIRLLIDKKITSLTLPPSALAALPERPVPTLRTITAAGEVCSADLVARWGRGRRFFNAYGPTEVTVWSTIAECQDTGRQPDLGRSIANVRTYILDDRLQPVPIGVPGQIYTGGAGVTRGHLNRPDLTAERFVPDPFSQSEGARMHKSGDLGRFLPDGSLDFIGRIDYQVKVRGFRVELGEIEHVLQQHPAIADQAVMLREDSPSDKRLVAYVIPQEGCALQNSEVLEYLRSRLPDYMIPNAIVILEKFPLTINRKLNRKALPEPGREASGLNCVGPRTPVEEILSGIWRQVLKLDSIDIHANFFELGGHSLIAAQMFSRMMESFKVDLSLRSVFEAPTIAELAGQIEQAMRELPGIEAPSLTPVPRSAELPLSYAQQRLWFIDQLHPGQTLYNIPGAVRLKGGLNLKAVQDSLTEIVSRHEVLRTSFPVRDGKPRQQIDAPARMPISFFDLSLLPETFREDAAKRLMSQVADRPFNLTSGPHLRVYLLRLSKEEHVLLVVMHHIVSDGWSIDILLREFDTLYKTYCAGLSSPLPELPIQYADFACWQRQWLQGDPLDLQLEFWRHKLTGMTTPQLPTDYPRTEKLSRPAERFSFQLPKSLYRSLKERCLQEGVTLFMILLAGFQALLHRHSGQTDIVTGSPAANRNRIETEGLIGYFVNPLALRTRFCEISTFRDLLACVRETVLGAYAHQDVPFEMIVDEIAPVRNMEMSPLFRTWFVADNAPARDSNWLSSLGVEFIPVQAGGARLDLALEMRAEKDLGGTFVYAADLYKEATIEQMAEHLEIILGCGASDPGVTILEIPLGHAQEVSDNAGAYLIDSEADFRF